MNDRHFSAKDIVKKTKVYKDLLDSVLTRFKGLEDLQHSFPVKTAKGIKYDDLVLLAADCKHKSLELLRNCAALASSAEIDYEMFEGLLLLEKSDEILKDHGFDRITDSLRNAAVSSNAELSGFAKVYKKLQRLEDQCTKLFSSFKSDEFNFGKLYDKDEYKGI